MWRFALIGAALVGALAPLPAGTVERAYSTGLYPPVQRVLTSLSNLLPFALLDALLVGVLVSWIWLLVRDITDRRGGAMRVVAHAALRTVTAAAALYLGFLATWGLNYRRVPLEAKLAFEPESVSAGAADGLAKQAVAEVNRLHRSADRAEGKGVDPSLAEAFDRTQSSLSVTRRARPGRPKRSVLDPYFRRAAVDGMTDPYFLETLIVSDLLPFERSFVVAHEWAHLAGFADEGEANFVGWLTCVSGSAAAQYSGWLFLYREVAGTLSGNDRQRIGDALEAGPRDDLRAIDRRIQQSISPMVSAAGWRVYDRYLKANRVEAGAASYAEVVRLVLGTRFSPSWIPVMRQSSASR